MAIRKPPTSTPKPITGTPAPQRQVRRPGAARRSPAAAAAPALAAAPEIQREAEAPEIQRLAEAPGQPVAVQASEASAAERIQVRAYFLHLERGGRATDPNADWLRAEQEMRRGGGRAHG